MTKIGQQAVRVVASVGLCLSLSAAATADGAGALPVAPASPVMAPTSTLDALLRTSEQRAAKQGEDAAAARAGLLEALRTSHTCFVENPTQKQLDYIERAFRGQPPAMFLNQGIANRFLSEGIIWFGVAPIGEPASTLTVPATGVRPASAIKLTYSFPADGVPWDTADASHVNDLNAQLLRIFSPPGAVTPERGREYVRQGLAAWRVSAGIRYEEVADNNEPLSTGPATSPSDLSVGNGDIRFGSFPQDAVDPTGTDSPILAYNNPPGLGGDMTLNSRYFGDPAAMPPDPLGLYGGSTANGYLLFRNAIAHEHGHGLGLMHVVPCDQTKLMEPFNSTRYDGPQVDDLRGIQENYGDRLTPNQTPAQADVNELADFGTLVDETGAVGSSILVPNLSTNGRYLQPDQSINPSGADWFKFRFEGPSPVRITARPARVLSGSTFYTYGPLVNMCVLMGNTVEQYLRAGNLNVEVYSASDPTTPIVVSSPHNPGQPGEILFGAGAPLPAGDYYIRVYDSGGDAPPPTRPIQLYDFEVRVGDPALGTTSDMQFAYKPIAVAGINKRVLFGQPVQFIGDLNSTSQEPDNALITRGFEWDITGPNGEPGADGVFEISNTPPDGITPTPASPPNLLREPVFAGYTTNGVFPVRLRVTDSSGQSATDTIYVTVVGAPITLDHVDPNSGQRGFSVPVTIFGTGLGGITQLNQISLSMPGDITVTGTPTPNPAGTQIDGLTFVIANNATLGPHDLQITDGVTIVTLTGAFSVVESPRPTNDECAGALHWDLAPLSCFPLPHDLPFDNRGASRSTVPTAYGSPLCDNNGGIENDVWYSLRSEDLCIDPAFPRLRVTTDSNDLGRGAARFSSRVAIYYGPDCGDVLATRAIGCGQDRDSPVEFDWQPGRIYLFRVGSRDASKAGVANVHIENIISGACCASPLGTCTAGMNANCASGSVWIPGAVCSPNPCTPTEGACCNRGVCTQTTSAACSATWMGGMVCTPNPCPPPLDGACCDPATGICQIAPSAGGCPAPLVFMGQGTVCTPNPCVQPPMGVCCVATACSVTSQAACSGMWHEAGACTPNPCLPPLGSCCTVIGVCSVVAQSECTGTWTGGGSCTPNLCPPSTGSCCAAQGACSVSIQSTCAGVWSSGGTCSPNPCPQPPTGACCILSVCSLVTQTSCNASGGDYRGNNVPCGPSTCTPLNGACCLTNGDCIVVLGAQCTGVFQGPSTSCLPSPCPAPTGSCCTGSACAVVTAANCTGSFGGAGTTCASVSCCAADVNHSNTATEPTVQDIFYYLGLWFTMDPAADLNGDLMVTLDDLFRYLTLYFTGCEMHPCCVGTTCTLQMRDGCVHGRWDTTSTACAAPTCCQADLDSSGSAGPQDIFIYLGLWFSGDPAADLVPPAGVPTLQDLFQYLDLYFAGCP